MTAAFDATRGTDQRFSDALSGSDGTADPSVTMPVLDVYPDALSAPMPVDLVPVVVPPIAPMRQPGVRAEPVRGPGARPAGGLTPAQQRMATQRPPRPGPAQRQPVASYPAGQQRPATGGRPALPTPAQQVPHTFNWQGKAMSASDIAAMVRASLHGQLGQVDRQSFQATHPQSMGSTAPAAVAPAAPMASQYGGRGQARNDARERGQERRRTAVPGKKRSSSVGAVLVFLVIIMFATGLGRKIIELVTELLNQ